MALEKITQSKIAAAMPVRCADKKVKKQRVLVVIIICLFIQLINLLIYLLNISNINRLKLNLFATLLHKMELLSILELSSA